MLSEDKTKHEEVDHTILKLALTPHKAKLLKSAGLGKHGSTQLELLQHLKSSIVSLLQIIESCSSIGGK